jgi:hypothetical protein
MSSLTRRECVVIGMVLLAVMTASIFASPAQAQSVAPADEWKFSITPYLWLPNINGELKYNIPQGGGGSPEVETGPNEYLQNLQGLMLLSADVRRGRWSVFTDLIYLSFADEESKVKAIDFGGSLVSSSVNLATSTTFRGMTWTLATGYAIQTGMSATLDVFGGVRYFGLKATTDWQLTLDVSGPGGGQTFPRSGGISEREDLWDAIIGIRGRVPLGSSDWSIPYYFDIGAGSSSPTCQVMLGIAYSFKWGETTLAYRDLYYDQGNDKLLQNFRFSGPALGATIRF